MRKVNFTSLEYPNRYSFENMSKIFLKRFLHVAKLQTNIPLNCFTIQNSFKILLENTEKHLEPDARVQIQWKMGVSRDLIIAH